MRDTPSEPELTAELKSDPPLIKSDPPSIPIDSSPKSLNSIPKPVDSPQKSVDSPQKPVDSPPKEMNSTPKPEDSPRTGRMSRIDGSADSSPCLSPPSPPPPRSSSTPEVGRTKRGGAGGISSCESTPPTTFNAIVSNHSSNSMSEFEDEISERSADTDDTCDSFTGNGDTTRYRRSKSMYGVNPNINFGPKAVMRTTHNVKIQDPANQRLNWTKAPLTVLVIKKIHDDSIRKPFADIIVWLIKEKRMVVFLEEKSVSDEVLLAHEDYTEIKTNLCSFDQDKDDLTDKIDLIICLGGDGTLLYASSLFQESVPPVMAFHLGSLGFLSPFDVQNATVKINKILQGNAPLTLRTRLKCNIAKRGSRQSDCSIKNVESRHHLMVMNEVVISRGSNSYLCNLDLYIEHKYVTSVQGDGLIISTPTGSTAYAAAAGASMCHPCVPAIVIVPICAHSLSFRPVMVPAGVEIKVVVSPDSRSDTASISFDGRNRQELNKGDALRISTSIYPVPAISNEDQMSDWFNALGRCLHWNIRKKQKPLYHNEH